MSTLWSYMDMYLSFSDDPATTINRCQYYSLSRSVSSGWPRPTARTATVETGSIIRAQTNGTTAHPLERTGVQSLRHKNVTKKAMSGTYLSTARASSSSPCLFAPAAAPRTRRKPRARSQRRKTLMRKPKASNIHDMKNRPAINNNKIGPISRSTSVTRTAQSPTKIFKWTRSSTPAVPSARAAIATPPSLGEYVLVASSSRQQQRRNRGRILLARHRHHHHHQDGGCIIAILVRKTIPPEEEAVCGNQGEIGVPYQKL